MEKQVVLIRHQEGNYLPQEVAMHGAVENETAPDQPFADKSLGIKFYSVFPCSGTILVLWFPAVFKLLICVFNTFAYTDSTEKGRVLQFYFALCCLILSSNSDAADNKMGY